MSSEMRKPSEARVNPEQRLLSKRIPPSSLWVASGMVNEMGKSSSGELVASALKQLENRKPEDLKDHHEKVTGVSKDQRLQHWQERVTQDSSLKDFPQQIENWKEGVASYVHKLGHHADIETLGVISDALMINPEEFLDPQKSEVERSTYLKERIGLFYNEYLQGQNGGSVERFAQHFTEGRSLEENLDAIEKAHSLFGVFGGAEAVKLVKEAIIAQAYLQEAQDASKKPELFSVAKEILQQEIPTSDVNLYRMIYQGAASLRRGPVEPVVPISSSQDENTDLEPAPVNKNTEEQTKE